MILSKGAMDKRGLSYATHFSEGADLIETKYTLKVDNPNPAPEEPVTPEFGSEPTPEMGDDKPFDDEPFEAGVEADETSEPKEYIQQLSGKLGQSLRKYEKDMGTPDLELEKFAVNSVLSATNTGEMDDEDQKDIIKKVKSSGLDNGIEPEAAPEGGKAPTPDPAMDEPMAEPEGEPEVPELGEGAEEGSEYDAMKVYHDKHPSVDEGLKMSIKNGTIAENLRSILTESFPKKKFVRTKNGRMGATIWEDEGKISLTLHDVSSNSHGFKNNREIFGSYGVAPEQFTKDFIIDELTSTDNGMGQAYITDIEPWLNSIDELLTKVQPMVQPQPEVQPEVQPKREVEQPKRIKERDLPFRKPVRETKTKPKAKL